MSKLEYYHQKFGAARVQSMVPAMTKNFAEVGVKYSMGGMTGSTLDSHRLATWAKDKHGLQKQDEVMTHMFQAYFSDEKFLGDRAVLVAAAEAAGLPAEDARKMLEDEQAYLGEVQAELSMAQQLQVSGVPFFVFHPPAGVSGRPLGVSGAQPTETIVEILSDDLGLDEERSDVAEAAASR